MTTKPLMESPPTSKRRWLVLGPMLGVAAWLAIFGDKTPSNGRGAVSLPVRAAAHPIEHSASNLTSARPTSITGSLPLLTPRQQLMQRPAQEQRSGHSNHDLFSGKNWNPPPPPPPKLDVVAPTAPPLPFTFLGKKMEDGIWEVYLSRGELTFIVHEGMAFESNYRVDKIGATTLTLTFLPLNQTQTLAIGDDR